jgi:2-dehydropantoate 2-reductase
MDGARSILMVGCGAMGGIFAERLSHVAPVTAYDTDAEHVAAIRADGLRVTAGGEERTGRLEAVADPAELAGRRFDAAVFLVKSGATAEALRRIRPVLHESTVLLTLQNGTGNAEQLVRVPDATVARGVTLDAGRYLGPGRVEHLIRGQPTFFGPVRGRLEDLRWLGEAFAGGGIPCEVVADPMPAVWAKFVMNAVMNPIGALLLGVNAARYEVPQVVKLIDEMAEECVRVVEALGGRLAFDPLANVKRMRAGELPLSRHAGSTALDIARGVPTEIEELTGFVVREGERLGIPVPNCRVVYRLVKGLERAAALRAAERHQGGGP